MFEHMTDTHVGRLFNLYLRMKSITRKEFNFDVWCNGKGCGTVACVLGHAGLMEKFRRLGLKTYKSNNVEFHPKTDEDIAAVARVSEERGYSRSLTYLNGSSAGAAFFGLSSSQARLFYIPFVYGAASVKQVTPAKVAKVLLAICRLQNPILTAELEKKAK